MISPPLRAWFQYSILSEDSSELDLEFLHPEAELCPGVSWMSTSFLSNVTLSSFGSLIVTPLFRWNVEVKVTLVTQPEVYKGPLLYFDVSVYSIQIFLRVSKNVADVFEFVRGLQNITKVTGEAAKLICEIKSDPSPIDITWFRNDAPINLRKKSSRITIKNTERKLNRYMSRLRITKLDVHDSGFYKCLATNNQRQQKSSTGILNVYPHQGKTTFMTKRIYLR